MYDLMIKGGLLVDPSQGIHAFRDVALSEGKVVAVEEGLDDGSAGQVVNASDKIVTPGLIDLHAHVYHLVTPLGVEADSSCLAKGTTTVLDVGSAGVATFPGFRRYIIETCKTRVYALLNINPLGLLPFRGEVKGRDVNMKETVEMIEKNRDVVQGIKWHSTCGIEALLQARQAADLAKCHLMCENSAYFWFPIRDLLCYLRKGDMLTHSFQGGPGMGILDLDGKVLPEVREAVKRGVILDVGHGSASFSFDAAEKALKQGILPGTISTDLHSGSINGPVYDLPTTISKYLMLGLSLDEAIKRTTVTPAQILGMADTLGTLRIGSVADAVVFQMREGDFKLVDADTTKKPEGRERVGHQKLVPDTVIRRGQIYSSIREQI